MNISYENLRPTSPVPGPRIIRTCPLCSRRMIFKAEFWFCSIMFVLATVSLCVRFFLCVSGARDIEPPDRGVFRIC